MRAFRYSLFLTLGVAGTVASYACSATDSEADASLDISQRDGSYELYYDDGQLEEKGTYKGGERDGVYESCLLYTSPSPRDKRQSRMPSSA